MGGMASRERADHSSVVMIILAGGKRESFSRPVSAQEVMLRHPHHVLIHIDLLTSDVSKVLVGPGTVLLPGEKYFLVPQRTVEWLLDCQLEPGKASSTHRSGSPHSDGFTGPGHSTIEAPASGRRSYDRAVKSPSRAFRRSSPKVCPGGEDESLWDEHALLDGASSISSSAARVKDEMVKRGTPLMEFKRSPSWCALNSGTEWPIKSETLSSLRQLLQQSALSENGTDDFSPDMTNQEASFDLRSPWLPMQPQHSPELGTLSLPEPSVASMVGYACNVLDRRKNQQESQPCLMPPEQPQAVPLVELFKHYEDLDLGSIVWDEDEDRLIEDALADGTAVHEFIEGHVHDCCKAERVEDLAPMGARVIDCTMPLLEKEKGKVSKEGSFKNSYDTGQHLEGENEGAVDGNRIQSHDSTSICKRRTDDSHVEDSILLNLEPSELVIGGSFGMPSQVGLEHTSTILSVSSVVEEHLDLKGNESTDDVQDTEKKSLFEDLKMEHALTLDDFLSQTSPSHLSILDSKVSTEANCASASVAPLLFSSPLMSTSATASASTSLSRLVRIEGQDFHTTQRADGCASVQHNLTLLGFASLRSNNLSIPKQAMAHLRATRLTFGNASQKALLMKATFEPEESEEEQRLPNTCQQSALPLPAISPPAPPVSPPPPPPPPPPPRPLFPPQSFHRSPFSFKISASRIRELMNKPRQTALSPIFEVSAELSSVSSSPLGTF